MGDVVLPLLVICLIVFLIAAGLVYRDTKRGHGKWGMNIKPRSEWSKLFFQWKATFEDYTVEVNCPKCGIPLPKKRKPASIHQALWGGWTCSNCHAAVDKWGKEVT